MVLLLRVSSNSATMGMLPPSRTGRGARWPGGILLLWLARELRRRSRDRCGSYRPIERVSTKAFGEEGCDRFPRRRRPPGSSDCRPAETRTMLAFYGTNRIIQYGCGGVGFPFFTDKVITTISGELLIRTGIVAGPSPRLTIRSVESIVYLPLE